MEIKTTNLEEIKAIAEDLLEKFEAAETKKDRTKYEEDLAYAVNYYTATSKAKCYSKARDAEDPMKWAILEFYYPTIRVKETKDKETNSIVREIVSAKRRIDLRELHKKIGGIGADKCWYLFIQRFNAELTSFAIKELNSKKVDMSKMKMDDGANDINLGKNPCSNTQLLKSIQTIVTAMLGEEYKAKSYDARYLNAVYITDNRGSANGVKAMTHKGLTEVLTKICYRILTDGEGYDVEQREIKNK